MQQFQQLIPCFRRSKVILTPGFKSLPKMVRLTPPWARTSISPFGYVEEKTAVFSSFRCNWCSYSSFYTPSGAPTDFTHFCWYDHVMWTLLRLLFQFLHSYLLQLYIHVLEYNEGLRVGSKEPFDIIWL